MRCCAGSDAEFKVLLEARNVSKAFGNFVAVDSVDFEVWESEIVGLIGPNGAGKSTFFNCLVGEHAPSTGSILFRGTDVTRATPERHARLGIARTHQVPATFEEMTVLENIMVGAFLRHPRRRDAEASAWRAIELTELHDHAQQRATSLGTPGRKRLEIARALATEPDLLLLDEALAGLNPAETKLAIELVRRIHGSGITLVIVEHVMEVILTLTQRLLVFNHGRLIASGDPREVVDDAEVIEAYLGRSRVHWTGRGARSGRSQQAADNISCPRALTGQVGTRMGKLRVDHLEVRYGDLVGVADVSLEVEEGGVVALLGSNGAGKTTTLNAIAGLVAPHSGTIEWAGENLTGLPAFAIVGRGLALSPEGWRLFVGQTVEQNLLLGATPLHDRKRVPAQLERVYGFFPRLRERRRQQAGTLSGGERQMLAVGRALMSAPRLLLLDEPSLGLAPAIVEDLYETLGRFRQEGLTLLLAEQSIPLALAIADYGYVLQTGRTVLQGPAEQLTDDPQVRHIYLGIAADADAAG